MVRAYGWDIVGNDGFRPSMVSDVAGRVDFMIPPYNAVYIPFTANLADSEEDEFTLHATLTYIWFVPPPPAAQNRMQQGIIRRIQTASPEEKQRILNRDIPAMMAARNTMESTYPPVRMASTQKKVKGSDPTRSH